MAKEDSEGMIAGPARRMAEAVQPRGREETCRGQLLPQQRDRDEPSVTLGSLGSAGTTRFLLFHQHRLFEGTKRVAALSAQPLVA